MGIKAFDLQHALSIDPQLLADLPHEHDRTVYSVAIIEKGKVDSRKLIFWLNRLVQEKGRDIFRIKGILDVDNEDRRFVFQGVHMVLDGRPGRPWQPGEARTNELVFIGRNLDAQRLRQGFSACFVRLAKSLFIVEHNQEHALLTTVFRQIDLTVTT